MLILHEYGRTDRVRGLFYVTTQFFCYYFLPLFPWKSYLVLLDNPRASMRSRIELPLSYRSIAFVWLRFVSLIIINLASPLFLIFIGLMIVDWNVINWRAPGPWMTLGSGGVIVLCFIALVLIEFKSWANLARALELAALAGISPEMLARHLAAKIGPPELEQLAQQLEEYKRKSSNSLP